MIPIGDVNPRRSVPVVTLGMIALNVLVFFYQLGLPPEGLEAFWWSVGVVPARLVEEPGVQAAGTLLTAMFVHGGWGHLLSNMLFLWIFGDNVEDRLGALTFLGLYLVGGVVASLAQVAVSPASTVPIVGASGALSAIAGTYLVLFPRARVHVAVPLLLRVIEVSAATFFAIWFVVQAFQGLASLVDAGPGGVAWFAHLGGFVAGAVAGLLVRGVAVATRPDYDPHPPA